MGRHGRHSRRGQAGDTVTLSAAMDAFDNAHGRKQINMHERLGHHRKLVVCFHHCTAERKVAFADDASTKVQWLDAKIA